MRRLNAGWDVELAGGVPPTTRTVGKGLSVVGSVPFNGQEVATAKWISPSVLIDYKFRDEQQALRPYVGIGVNYTYFYDRNSTPAGDAANGGPTRISLSHSVGPVASAGVLYRIKPDINVMASYSAARVNSDYESTTSGVIRTSKIHFNPHALVMAVGYSF